MIFFFLWTVILPVTGNDLVQFYAPVGGSVYLFPSSNVSPEYRITWYLGATSTKIAELVPSMMPVYTGRCLGGACELFLNGTLRMDQLAVADNRTYTVSTQLGSITQNQEVRLLVYNLLSPPGIAASSSVRPVNGTELNLRCDGGSQTVLNINFYRNDELVTCNQPHLSCNDTSPVIYFNPILDTDSGNYSCLIRNPVSQSRSAPLILSVAVQVSAVTLAKNATRPVTVDKDAVALKCSSYGTDLTYEWSLTGSPLPQNPRYQFADDNATLLINPVTKNDQGEFTCTVSNYLNSGVSNPINLTWSPDGHISCDAQKLNSNIRLGCSWPGGYPPAQIHLLHPNMNLTQIDTASADVPSHQFVFGAPLSCTGTQLEYSQSCSLSVDVPQFPGFSNDSVRSNGEGSSAFLSVNLLDARVGPRLIAGIFPSTFSWFRLEPDPTELFPGGNISIISNDYSSFLIVHRMSQEWIGRYMCSAVNPIGSNAFTFLLNLTKVEEDELLSAGAIAGIVIGSAAVLAIIGLTLVLLFCRKSKVKETVIAGTGSPGFPKYKTEQHELPTHGANTDGRDTCQLSDPGRQQRWKQWSQAKSSVQQGSARKSTNEYVNDRTNRPPQQDSQQECDYEEVEIAKHARNWNSTGQGQSQNDDYILPLPDPDMPTGNSVRYPK